MRIFLDSADVDTISDFWSTGLVDGITTNPTLIMRSGRKPEDVYQELVDLGVRDISMEVVGNSFEMIQEGFRLAKKFGKNTTIKVPCTRAGLLACKEFSKELIRVNVTLIFSAAQAVLAAKAGATYVSPFVGRLNDNSMNGMDLIRDIAALYKEQQHYKTSILSASIRDVKSVSDSFVAGADIVTIPPIIFDKMYGHALTEKGVELFDKDWSDVKSRLDDLVNSDPV
tara:strand:- start:229 stop:909 length:681 start_codon:yes stop_codon:yes gene_type:complete